MLLGSYTSIIRDKDTSAVCELQEQQIMRSKVIYVNPNRSQEKR